MRLPHFTDGETSSWLQARGRHRRSRGSLSSLHGELRSALPFGLYGPQSPGPFRFSRRLRGVCVEQLLSARLCARRRGGAVDQTWLSPGGAKNKAKRVPLMSNYDRGVKRPELKSCKVVIPNGFGTRDRFCGGQIFHRPEKG